MTRFRTAVFIMLATGLSTQLAAQNAASAAPITQRMQEQLQMLEDGTFKQETLGEFLNLTKSVLAESDAISVQKDPRVRLTLDYSGLMRRESASRIALTQCVELYSPDPPRDSLLSLQTYLIADLLGTCDQKETRKRLAVWFRDGAARLQYIMGVRDMDERLLSVDNGPAALIDTVLLPLVAREHAQREALGGQLGLNADSPANLWKALRQKAKSDSFGHAGVAQTESILLRFGHWVKTLSDIRDAGASGRQQQPLTAAEIRSVLERIRVARENLRDAIQGLTPEQWNFKDGSVTVGAVADHMVVIGIQYLSNGEAALVVPFLRLPVPIPDEALLAQVDLSANTEQTMPSPSGRSGDPASVLAQFEQLFAQATAMINEEVLRDRMRWIGPGGTSAYQAILALAEHTRVHSEGIAKMKRLPNFPRSANPAR